LAAVHSKGLTAEAAEDPQPRAEATGVEVAVKAATGSTPLHPSPRLGSSRCGVHHRAQSSQEKSWAGIGAGEYRPRRPVGSQPSLRRPKGTEATRDARYPRESPEGCLGPQPPTTGSCLPGRERRGQTRGRCLKASCFQQRGSPRGTSSAMRAETPRRGRHTRPGRKGGSQPQQRKLGLTEAERPKLEYLGR
jgi:hypothetical protein